MLKLAVNSVFRFFQLEKKKFQKKKNVSNFLILGHYYYALNSSSWETYLTLIFFVNIFKRDNFHQTLRVAGYLASVNKRAVKN